MRIDILTLFPQMFTGPLEESIIGRAVEGKLVQLKIHNIRDYTHNKHHTVDDYPYGGGSGMILKPEPLFEAVDVIRAALGQEEKSLRIILMTPQGRLFSQEVARELSREKNLLIICGRYEGVDERIREHLANDEISIGDYIITGGELAAMVIVDAVVRLLPGVLGAEIAVEVDSHASGLLEYPQYTRPQTFRGWEVPEVLLSGNHAEIARWRSEQSVRRTLRRRPELIRRAKLSAEERKFLEKTREENPSEGSQPISAKEG